MAHVNLRPLHQDLVEELHRKLQPSELYLHNDDDRTTLAELRARLTHAEEERSPENPQMVWLYRLVQSREHLVGMIEIGIFPEDYAEIGFVIFPEFQRQGNAVAGIKLMLDTVWARWPSIVVHAFTRRSNLPAQRTLVRAGFELQMAKPGGKMIPPGELLYVAAAGSVRKPPSL